MNKDIILLISAMKEELNSLSILLKESNIKYKKNNDIYSFSLSNTKECYVTSIGISFFNIANLTKLIDKIKPTEIILVGTEAGLNKQKIGEVIVSNNIVCSDLDLVSFNYLDGTIDKVKRKTIGPLMASGSHFMSTKKDKDNLKKRFKGVSTFDMESYIVYRVCLDYHIPFIVMKAISDNGEKDPDKSFKKNLEFASRESIKYALKFISKKSIKTLLK